MIKHTIYAAGFGLTMAATPLSAATFVYQGQDINPGPGAAAPSNPNSDAAAANFFAALSGTSTESFEGFTAGTSAPLSLSFTGSAGTLGATLTGSGDVRNNPRSAPSGSGQFATDGSQYYAVDSSNFQITFDSSIAAFGFYATDLEDLEDIDIILNLVGGGSETYNLEALFGPPAGAFLASGSVHFLGFINTATPFSSVTFGGAGASSDILAFDFMTIGDIGQVTNPPGAVPEPATWAMMLLGFFGIGLSLRSRRAKVTGLRVRYS